MKIQQVRQNSKNVAFERKIEITKSAQKSIIDWFHSKKIKDQSLKNITGDSFIKNVVNAVERIPGNETYNIDNVKISGDRRRVTLNGFYNKIHDVSITVSSLADLKKVQSSFTRYTEKLPKAGFAS